FFEQILVLMREQNDRLFRMIHNFVGEVRLIVEDQGHIVFTWNIFGSDNHEVIPGNITFERNIFDAPTWNRTAHSNAMQHSGKREVIDVERLAGNFLPAFFARDGFADEVWFRSNTHYPFSPRQGFADLRLLEVPNEPS